MSEALIPFLVGKTPELIEKIYEQLYLAGSGIIIAILFSVPFGIWIAKNKKIRGAMLAIINILQTIPSLALLAFLIPFVGIGAKPAIIALSIYALLPIVRNTATGILNISPEYIEAADGLGFTKLQKLRMIELPMALPVIIVGIRTATTLCVGTATLAAFVGGGGLGDFIYQGLSSNNNRLILLGAIPSVILVLVLDFIIARIEMAFKRKNIKKRKLTYVGLTAVVVLSLLANFGSYLGRAHLDTVRVGARYQAEQVILAEIMAQVIESKTQLKVIRRFSLVSASMAHEAIVNNEIDMTPEYTGTAYFVNLHQSLARRPKHFFEHIKETYHRKYNIMWMDPFGFSNNTSLVIRKELADSDLIKTISDLKNKAPDLIVAVPSGYFLRDDGYKTLSQKYGLKFGAVKMMEIGLMYAAVSSKKVDVALSSQTDGRIQTSSLVVLEDDLRLFPDYSAAPIVREDFLRKYPEIKGIFRAVLGKITLSKMMAMNYEVEVNKESPAKVARRFLINNSII